MGLPLSLFWEEIMASRKVREKLRERRIELAKAMEEGRKKSEKIKKSKKIESKPKRKVKKESKKGKE